MNPSSDGPFRWWHKARWRAPVIDNVLYKEDEWVTTFLNHLDSELTRFRPKSVTLAPGRDALVVTGGTGQETLRAARATYRDVLLFHPRLHPEVERGVDAAVVAAATASARRGFAQANDILQGGREAVRDQPGALLHPTVVEGLRRLELSGLPPMGISGVVEVRFKDAVYVVASMRSHKVAVNPGCLGPSVDGGLASTGSGVDPKAGLWNEIKLELPGLLHDDDLHLLGTLLPPAAPTIVGPQPTLRCGVNVVYRATIQRDPVEVVLNAPDHFEARELMLIRTSGSSRSPGDLPPVLAYRDGRLVKVAKVPPLSEVLVSALAQRSAVDVVVGRPRRARPSLPKQRTPEARSMSINSSSARDLTLEDAWAEDLIERHSRLNRMLARERLQNLAETEAEPSLEMLLPVFDAVREYEFVRGSDQIKAADDARLFEALVYRIGRYLFGNDEKRALAAHDLMLPRDKTSLEPGDDPNPIGTTYTSRLNVVLDEDELEDPTGVWREEVTAALRTLNRNEAVQEYAEVARRGRLLCFCAALWSLETKRGPAAVTVALEDAYRKSLSGDVIALFFRARALLASPVISAAQTQLGLQFVTTALATFDHNPGMHHTKAIYLLRKSAVSEIESVSLDCLDQALTSVESALLWDAEFPKFYATRALVKYRLNDRYGALLDVRAAIELARYSESSPVVQAEVREWERLLDSWQLTPVVFTPVPTSGT